MDRNQMATGFMFMSKNDGETDELRCITSPRYVRIYDYDILSYIEGMQVTGWKPPPKNTVAPGGKRAANRTGLYRSDRNMFAFMVNEENRINDGTDEGLARGFFVGNSEVGGGSFFIKTFLYRYICGNHLVMGCREIQEVSLKHIGKGLKGTAMGALARDLTLYANSSVLEVETRIADAKLKTLGKDSEEVVDFMFKRLNLTKSNAIKAWDKCIEEEPELDPTSVWGMVQGITAVAREEEFTDSRVNMEKSATKLMELV
jgi:hypothetical protein